MPSDIEIAQAAKLQRISAVAREKLGIAEEHLEPYGHYKAKVSMDYIKSLKDRPSGKLILVTAITPTPARSRFARQRRRAWKTRQGSQSKRLRLEQPNRSGFSRFAKDAVA